MRQYTDDIIEKYPAGTVISIHEAPVREGFYYWKGSEYKAGQKYKVTEDHTFTAQWKKRDDASGDADSGSGTDKNAAKHNAKTGDETMILGWFAVIIASALAIVILNKRRRRSKE